MRRSAATAAIAAAMSLSGAAQALDFTRIDTEAAFRATVADRTLVDAFGGTRVFGGNGGLGGRQDASVITGGWVWHRGALCHRTLIDGIQTDENCAFVWLGGETLVMQTERGRSSEIVWTLRAE